jgi:hypothetical protein
MTFQPLVTLPSRRAMTDKANRWFYDPWIIAIIGGLVVGILILLVEIMLKANNQVSAGVDNTPSSVSENVPDHRVLGGSNAPSSIVSGGGTLLI